LSPAAPAYIYTLEPRYVETDQGGRIHHGAVVPWLEAARIAYLKQRGIDYAQVEAQNFFLIVRKLDARYLKAIYFGKTVEIHTVITNLGFASVRFSYDLWQANTACAYASTELACISRAGKPTPLPEFLTQKLTFQKP
jgi:acyl-CoA thioester hydrolase